MTHEAGSPLVVKVGGSLYDLPDLRSRLRAWLQGLGDNLVIIVPGGGQVANAVRRLDGCHQLGEERAHWLALQSLRLNAHFLAALLGEAIVVEHWQAALATRTYAVLDPYAFAVNDDGHPGSLPHSWSVTSDSIAARVAVVAGAHELILLKSADYQQSCGWVRAQETGLVDRYFISAICGIPRVKVINFRRWP